MTKKNVFIGAGAVVLAVASAFAGKASVKFAGAPNLFVSTAGGAHCVQITSAAVAQFTTVGTTGQATIKTIGGTARKIWANACTGGTAKAVYFHN